MEISKKNSILTPTEQRRLERKKMIIAEYKEVEGSYAPHRLMRVIADKYDVTISTVRNILVESGVYQPNR